jgi:hypothetical protein
MAVTDSLLTCAVTGEVERRGAGLGAATCLTEERGFRCCVGVIGRQRHDRGGDERRGAGRCP